MSTQISSISILSLFLPSDSKLPALRVDSLCIHFLMYAAPSKDGSTSPSKKI